jgi:predicted acetyltransferase
MNSCDEQMWMYSATNNWSGKLIKSAETYTFSHKFVMAHSIHFLIKFTAQETYIPNVSLFINIDVKVTNLSGHPVQLHVVYKQWYHQTDGHLERKP